VACGGTREGGRGFGYPRPSSASYFARPSQSRNTPLPAPLPAPLRPARPPAFLSRRCFLRRDRSNQQKYDVGQQIHLPFQGFEDHFSPSAKRALETKLQAALEEEAGDRRGVGAGGAKGGVDAMDTDGGSAYYKKRGGPGRPTRSTSAAAAAGSKREVEDAARKDSAAGYRKVYKLADFKGYQEMKEQVQTGYSLCAVFARRINCVCRVACGRVDLRG